MFFCHSYHQYFSYLNLPPHLSSPPLSSPHFSSPYLSSPLLTFPLFHSPGRPVCRPEETGGTGKLIERGVLIVGYSIAYIFHILSCGYLFRFVEFEPYSCFIGSYGWTVDRGGPDGMGFKHGRIGHKIHFPPSVHVPGQHSENGGGGDGGDGDGWLHLSIVLKYYNCSSTWVLRSDFTSKS